jgi:hypothetical protein
VQDCHPEIQKYCTQQCWVFLRDARLLRAAALQAAMPMLAAGAATASTSGSGGRRSRDLFKTVQNLELSLRFATAPYQPVDTIADCDERKPRANDRSRSAMDATTCPIGRG